MGLGETREGIKLAYCTDTRPVESIVEHAKQADLFICEGMYGEKGMEDKAISHKHMTFVEAANLAKEAKVNEMWLTHYSPSLIRPEEYVDDARRVFKNTKTAKDGKTKSLLFEEE